MTLKKNFENIIYNYIGSEWDRRDVSNSLETDAEEFAIDFVEWFDDLNEDYCKDYTIKELLEIYKKEKGL
jgi:hypothetical protein